MHQMTRQWTALVLSLVMVFVLGGAPAAAGSGKPTYVWMMEGEPSIMKQYADATPETIRARLTGVTDPNLIMAAAGRFVTIDPDLAEKILADHPEVQSYRYYTLDLYAIRIEQGRYQEGADLLKALIESNLKDQEMVGLAVMDLRMLFSYVGQAKQLLPYIESLYPYVSDNPVFLGEGLALAKDLGRWDLVEKYASQSLAVSGPGNGEKYLNLGMALLYQGKSSSKALGEYEEAKAWYEKALAVNPSNKDAQAEYRALLKKMK